MNILLIFPGFIVAFIIVLYYEHKIRNLSTKIRNLSAKPINKVHFYVARDMDDRIYLYLGKPQRCNITFTPIRKCKCIATEMDFKNFNLEIEDFKNLNWEDEPVEVFLNLEK